jgi:hypothetical protein
MRLKYSKVDSGDKNGYLSSSDSTQKLKIVGVRE